MTRVQNIFKKNNAFDNIIVPPSSQNNKIFIFNFKDNDLLELV